MMMQSTASTLGDSWTQRLPHSPAGARGLPPLPVEAHFPPRQTASGVSADDLPRGKILVIEDEAMVALDLQRTLRDAGYRVVGPAATLEDIQRLIDRGSIDCAVVDLDVDRRTPLPVADLLAFAEVPFVFLTTAVRGAPPQRHARRPVVTKPFKRSELLSAIERAMKRQSMPAANDNPGAAWPRVLPPL
jgi:CheY-like chemotaxis protein